MEGKGWLLKILLFTVFAVPGHSQANSPVTTIASSSSVDEIISWLDQNAFANARIGITQEVNTDHIDEIFRYDAQLSESAVFSNGFKYRSLENCLLILRNDDVKLLEFWSKSYNPRNYRLKDFLSAGNDGRVYYAEVRIPLYDLRPKIKGPYSHTSKTEKAASLGKWRVKFLVSGSSLWSVLRGRDLPDEVMVGIRTLSDGQFHSSLPGEILTFTFDEKRTAEEFRQAFGRAIQLCSPK